MDKFIVKEKDELYNYLRNNLNKSKNNIKSLLKNECIYVNNNVITKYNYVVNSGDIISIGKAITYKDVNLKIIYEDSDIIVIDKPTKILTISNSKEKATLDSVFNKTKVETDGNNYPIDYIDGNLNKKLSSSLKTNS